MCLSSLQRAPLSLSGRDGRISPTIKRVRARDAGRNGLRREVRQALRVASPWVNLGQGGVVSGAGGDTMRRRTESRSGGWVRRQTFGVELARNRQGGRKRIVSRVFEVFFQTIHQ